MICFYPIINVQLLPGEISMKYYPQYLSAIKIYFFPQKIIINCIIVFNLLTYFVLSHMQKDLPEVTAIYYQSMYYIFHASNVCKLQRRY